MQQDREWYSSGFQPHFQFHIRLRMKRPVSRSLDWPWEWGFDLCSATGEIFRVIFQRNWKLYWHLPMTMHYFRPISWLSLVGAAGRLIIRAARVSRNLEVRNIHFSLHVFAEIYLVRWHLDCMPAESCITNHVGDSYAVSAVNVWKDFTLDFLRLVPLILIPWQLWR